MQAQASLDDAPFSAFHRRIAIYSCGGPFCDGYILGIIAAALGPLSNEIGLTAGWQGIVGAAALVGMFVGGHVPAGGQRRSPVNLNSAPQGVLSLSNRGD
jgi:MFS transporter, putative metabolite transport protein